MHVYDYEINLMKRILLLFLILLPVIFQAQENSVFDAYRYIEKMDHTLNIKLELDNEGESFLYTEGTKRYNIEPNINTRVAISTHYRFLSIKIGFVPKVFSNIDSDKKGETKMFKIQGDIFVNNWIQNFEYMKVKGYFINNFNPILPVLPINDFVILSDLTTLSISGSTSYKYNDHFSLKSILNQTEIQRKSTGSTISSIEYGYFKMYDKTQDLDLRSFDLVLNTGFVYTHVINRKLYASLGGIPGLGIEFNKLVTIIEEKKVITKDNNFVFHLNAQMGIGYNSKSFYAGSYLKGIVAVRGKKSLVGFNTFRGVFQIYVGYRFKAPKFMKEGFDWMEDESPIQLSSN